MFALVLQILKTKTVPVLVSFIFINGRARKILHARSGARPFAKIRTGESKSKLACILPGGRIFDEVKGTNNSGKAAETGPPEAFFQPNVIFSARKCAKIKNMSIFAVPKQRFWVGRRGKSSSRDRKGEVPEWSIGPHSKCGVRATVPGVRIPLSPQTTLTIKVLHARAPKKEPIFKALLGAFLLSPLKQFAEEGGYSRKYLRLPKKGKKATANSTKIPKM